MRVIRNESGAHSTGEDVDRDAEGNEEASSDGVHTGEVGDGRGTAQDEHGCGVSRRLDT